MAARPPFPPTGLDADALAAEMDAAAARDIDPVPRFAPGMHYAAGRDVEAVAERAYLRFFWTNALYTEAYASVARFERELIAWAADLLHGPEAVGSITSGGSESNLMAVKGARDRARRLRPMVTEPAMVVAASAHPSFWKAAEYFGLQLIRVPLTADHRLDLAAYEAAITPDTVLLVASAPSLTLGMVDSVPEISAMAAARGISCHVDGCVGSFFLPWVERLGGQLPAWDFRSPGVTSISGDLHKFGYAAKGASMLLSRSPVEFADQPFRYGSPERPPDWYVTPSMTGTRPGGAIAAAWAVQRYLGAEGYLRLTARTMAYIRRLQAGIGAIDGLRVVGEPAMTVFTYTSDTLDIFAIAEGLEERGWLVVRDEWPQRAIRFMQSPGHEPYVDRYLTDLAEVAEEVRTGVRATTRDAGAAYVSASVVAPGAPVVGGADVRSRSASGPVAGNAAE